MKSTENLQQYGGYTDTSYLDETTKLTQRLKSRTYELMQIQPGHRVLDLGCGTGYDVIQMAALVGGDGLVVGVDHDETMVEEATKRALQAGVSERAHIHQADALSLPFDPEYFNACRSERVFMHLPDPDAVLAEMLRVTKPGGMIVLADTDFGTASLATSEYKIHQRIWVFAVENLLRNGYSGRRLYQQMRRQNLANLDYEVFPIVITSYQLYQHITGEDLVLDTAQREGIASKDEIQRLTSDLETADKRGEFWFNSNMIIVSGARR